MIEEFSICVTGFSALLWCGFALLPWRPWANREVLDAAEGANGDSALDEITVLVPARNEAEVIRQTLQSLSEQGPGLKIVLIDDNSEDATIDTALQMRISNLRIIRSETLPAGWSGKLWALEQGRKMITTPYTLLLDADIELAQGVAKGAQRKDATTRRVFHFADGRALHVIRLGKTADARVCVLLQKSLSVSTGQLAAPREFAAAAGGCVLMETRRWIKSAALSLSSRRSSTIAPWPGASSRRALRIWLGLTHSAKSIRGYDELREIWDMVARTAFAQLHYSAGLLILCTLAMLLGYLVPVVMVGSANSLIRWLALASLMIMFLTYIPILRFYHRSWAWALALPLIAALFLAMTWTSAIRYWRGEKTRWKGRSYRR